MESTIDIYLTYQPLETTFFSIANGDSGLLPDDYEAENFWGIDGGLEIVINGYCSIFKSADFDYFLIATNFLIHSIYKLKNIPLDESSFINGEEDNINEIVLLTTGKDKLVIENSTTDIISLSYLPANNIIPIQQKGNRYFSPINVSKSSWLLSAEAALIEYFKIAERVVEISDNIEMNKAITKYINWGKNAIPYK